MEKEQTRASTNEDRLHKSHDPIRCAKAAMLLLSLGTCRDQQVINTLSLSSQSLVR